MNLKSMKMTAEEKKSMIEGPAMSKDAPRYPYGLNIHLNDEVMQKLGLESLPKVGTKMMIMAVAVVESVSERDSQDGGKRQDMSIQITDMSIEPHSDKKGEKELAKSLYGSDSEDES